MNNNATVNRFLNEYNEAIGKYSWTGFEDFDRVWIESLEIHCFLRHQPDQNTGFFIEVTYENRRFRTTILLFRTILNSAEDIFYSTNLDGTTTQVELGFFLMRIYDLTAQEASLHADFNWSRKEAFTNILSRMHTALLQYALPWLIGDLKRDL